jgi:hypothetical protein
MLTALLYSTCSSVMQDCRQQQKYWNRFKSSFNSRYFNDLPRTGLVYFFVCTLLLCPGTFLGSSRSKIKPPSQAVQAGMGQQFVALQAAPRHISRVETWP